MTEKQPVKIKKRVGFATGTNDDVATKPIITPWYKISEGLSGFDSYINLDHDIAKPALLEQAMQFNLTVKSQFFNGLLINCSIPQLLSKIKSRVGLKLIIEKFPSPYTGKSFAKVFFSERTYLAIQFQQEIISLTDKSDITYKVSTYSLSTDLGEYKKLINVLKQYVKDDKEESKAGYVYSIQSTRDGLDLIRIGAVNSPIERGNYTQEVLDAYDVIVKDLKSEIPGGRIAILDGCPGGGKSYLVRSILQEFSNALCVLVPPKLVNKLGDPSFIPLLLEYKEEFSDGEHPILLILEDADSVLTPRSKTNIDSITSALNMGDGIFGELFNIRIIATTNAELKELEPALLRPGRLSCRVKVGTLPKEHCISIFKRLLPNKDIPDKKFKDEMTLAEVYALAKKYGWEPKSNKLKKIDNWVSDGE